MFRVVLAALTWATLALQFTLSVRAEGLGLALVNLLGYFTILTNLFVALVLTVPALAPASAAGKRFARADVQLSAVASIIIVGLVYHALLAGQWDPQGWDLVSDTGLHTVVPIGFTLHWLLAAPKEALTRTRVATVMLYPVAYTVYVLLRGELLGRYPYFFIDVNTLGYAAAVRNTTGILLLFLLVAAGMSAVAKRVPRLATQEEGE